MSAISIVNPKAEHAKSNAALAVNLSAAKRLQSIMATNLGPHGTVKMLVSGAGDLKMTKDGCVLLNEMQITHPTAVLIARSATAQDDTTGDGTTSNVLIIGEVLQRSIFQLSEGIHPTVVVNGIYAAKNICLQVLDRMRWRPNDKNFHIPLIDRSALTNVALTALKTKLISKVSNVLAQHIVEAVLAIKSENEPIDLHMVEIMEIMSKVDIESSMIKGIVMDHGARHPNMKTYIQNVHVLTLNVSLEYEKSEINSGFYYKSSEQREKLVDSERKHTDDKCWKIVELKNKICKKGENFFIANQKGIDPLSLEILAQNDIVALRRAKRRNMERLTKACGGEAVNSLEDLTPEVLGYAGLVYQTEVGDEKYTFVEDCKNPTSVTMLLRGPNKYTLAQLKCALRDGLRAVANTIEDGCLIPGAAAFELEAYKTLQEEKKLCNGNERIGMNVFAEGLLVIPKTLASNSGLNMAETMVKLENEIYKTDEPVGINLESGCAFNPIDSGIFDNYRVKKQVIQSGALISTNLLLVDEIMRAGLSSLKEAPGQ